MHCAEHFKQSDKEPILGLIHEHPLATLTTVIEGQLEANHLPLLWRDNGSPWGCLVGHIARKDPLARAGLGSQALVMFQGPQRYISPNWYATKAEHGKVVPTWNYLAVHAWGPLVFHDSPEWILTQLTELTNRHEGEQPHPWGVSDAPSDFTERLVGALIGIEVRIERVQSKFKLSQNQPVANQLGVIEGLRLRDPNDPIAHRMQGLLDTLKQAHEK
jgi:transcriptional regulator